MLVITRRIEESFVIGGNIRVMVLAIEGGRVKLGIDAPRIVSVMRAELLNQAGAERKAAATDRTPQE